MLVAAETPAQSRTTWPRIVAAIPCWNTAATIADVVRRTRRYVDEVIVVDDGSTDHTAAVALAAGAVIEQHEVNRGYGEAIKSCFRAGRERAADILVTIDGDGQHNPDEIPSLVSPILRGEAGLTIGSRFLKDHVEVPCYRQFGIRFITWLFNVGSRTKVSDSQSGYRAYGRGIIDRLICREDGMSISVEVLQEARRARCRIIEVPIRCFYASAKPDVKAFKHGFGVALGVIRVRCRSARWAAPPDFRPRTGEQKIPALAEQGSNP